ncbi:MAG: hypothetical protein R3C41_05640 [Calditrichia bacterium]
MQIANTGFDVGNPVCIGNDGNNQANRALFEKMRSQQAFSTRIKFSNVLIQIGQTCIIKFFKMSFKIATNRCLFNDISYIDGIKNKQKIPKTSGLAI